MRVNVCAPHISFVRLIDRKERGDRSCNDAATQDGTRLSACAAMEERVIVWLLRDPQMRHHVLKVGVQAGRASFIQF
jgi:hypothetical protein